MCYYLVGTTPMWFTVSIMVITIKYIHTTHFGLCEHNVFTVFFWVSFLHAYFYKSLCHNIFLASTHNSCGTAEINVSW